MLLLVFGSLLLGGVMGYLAWTYLRLRLDLKTSILAGMVGGLIIGFGARAALGVFGAPIGAALVIWLTNAMQKKP